MYLISYKFRYAKLLIISHTTKHRHLFITLFMNKDFYKRHILCTFAEDR